MSDWNERIRLTRAEFFEGLERRGWRLRSDQELTGNVNVAGSDRPVRVTIPLSFPFTPPRAFPDDATPHSWHRELDGAMCLYPESGRGSLPWLDVDDFIETVTRWLTETSHGWPADDPDLDLDRYFEPASDFPLVLYDERIESLSGRYVRFAIDGPRILLVGSGTKPVKGSPRRLRLFGFIADIGEPPSPPRNWDELSRLLLPEVANTLERRIQKGQVDLLLVRYSRGDSSGTLALSSTAQGDEVQLRSFPSASMSREILQLRSGRDSDALSMKNVLIVGIGAIGSHLCDQLTRAGVGRITVRDGDILRPGNSVRHLLPIGYAGHPKAAAVSAFISQRSENESQITPDPRFLHDPREVPDLLAEFDLVIDASADTGASAMLADAARAYGTHIVSASLQNEGKVVRVDIIPPVSGSPLQPAALADPDGRELYEPGCGDPVSMTPPYAAVEAAAVATRVVVEMLTGSTEAGAGRLHAYG